MSFRVAKAASPPGEDVSTSRSLSLLALLIESSGLFMLALWGAELFVKYCSICEKALAIVLREPSGDRGVAVVSVAFDRGKSGMRD